MNYPDTLGKIDSFSAEKQKLLRRMLAKKGMDTFALPIPVAHSRDLSFAQNRLWFLHSLGLTQTYNMVNALILEGEVDIAALSQAYIRLQERHEVLRTRIVTRDGSPQPEVDPLPNASLFVIGDQAASLEAVIDTIVKAEHNRTFDLENGPLMHVTLAKASSTEWVLVVNIHHIISDLWSMSVIIREISALYSASLSGVEADLPNLSIQYNDYAVWQKSYLEGPSGEQQLSFWTKELAGVPSQLDLPLDFSRPAKQTQSGAMVPIHISEDVMSELRANTRILGATDFMIFLGIYQWLLADFSGQRDIVIGTPIAGRRKPELEPLIGMFVNTLALRSQIDSGQSFVEHIKKVKEKTLNAFSNQELPFEAIVQVLNPARDLSYSPVFQVMFILQNMPAPEIRFPGLKISPIRGQIVDAKFDLTLTLSKTEHGYSGSFVYNTDLFQEATIQNMVEHYRHLLVHAAKMHDQPKYGTPSISETSRRLLCQWNSEVDGDYVSTLPALMKRQALSNPNAPAVVMDGVDVQLSYRDLHQRAAELAHRLRLVGVRKDTPVGVCMYRSCAMPLSLLAIWNAGGSYVPLDPDYPVERLRLIMVETGMSIILTEVGALTTAEALGETIFVDPYVAMSSSCFEDDPLPDQLAYILFTSGSTGKPKGSMIDHRAICNRLNWMQQTYTLNDQDRVLQKTPYSFDVSVWEFFWPLMVSATLVISRPGGHKDPNYLAELIQRQRITTLHFVPSMLAAFLDSFVEEKSWKLKVFSSGEALSSQLAQRFFQLMPQSCLYNLYGPTEAAIDVSYHACAPDYGPAPVPIGRPINNINLWVVNSQLQLVTPGARGRLVIGGIGLARGYCGAPAQTAARFLPDPFAQAAGSRIYDTGDLARHRGHSLSHMELEYLGRADFQVKLRGFRIEIEEIENTLIALPGIRDVAVSMRMLAGDQQLIAYFVEDHPLWTASTLRISLLERLPEFMIPALFVSVEHIPINANGKKDRSALPDPFDLADENQGDLPKTATEEIVAGIWTQLLCCKVLGRSAHFFQLGGHSLLAVRMLNSVRTAFQAQLSVETIFKHPRLQDFSAAVELACSNHDENLPAPVAVLRPDILPLSAAQKRMWFLNQLHGPGSDYNMPLALRLKGVLHVGRLREAVSALIERHEILRTRFGSHNGEPQQIIDKDLSFTTVFHLLTPGSSEDAIQRHFCHLVSQSFDLEKGPLWQIYCCSVGDDSHYILVVVHHIISDGWSTGILIRDLVALYDNNSTLPPLSVQYADYTLWTLSQPYRATVSRAMHYWSVQLTGCEKPVLLETDFPRALGRCQRAASCSFSLSGSSSKALEVYAKANNSTMFMATLGAYGLLLSRYTGSDDLTIGTPIAGRTHASLENLIGLFLNTLVLRIDLSGDITFAQLLQRVRHMSLQAFENQHAPFDLLVEKLLPNRKLEQCPLFQVMFVFQNFDLPQIQMGDLEASSFAIEAQGAARTDLDFYLYETPSGLRGRFIYNADLFLPATIERFSYRLTNVLERIAEGFEQSIHLLPLQRDMILYGEKLFHNPLPICEEEIPLSAHQQRLWFIDRFENGSLYEASPVYHNMPFLMRVYGDLNVALLEQSLAELIKLNPLLRANVNSRNGQGFLILSRHRRETMTIRKVSSNGRQNLIMEDVLRPFDLAKDCLLRAYVYQDEGENFLLINVHHMLVDSMSLNLLARALTKIYRNMATGRRLDVANGAHYLDFIRVQQQFTDQSLEPQWFYWKRRLKGKLQPLELPLDRPRPAVHTFTTASLQFSLAEHIVPFKKSPQMVYEHLLTAFLCILRRYSGQDEIVVGNSMPCRLSEPLAHMIGPLANLIVLRVFFGGKTTYEEVQMELRAQIAGAKIHQELPFDLLVQKLKPEKDMSRTALFDVLFQWEEIDTHFDLGNGLRGEGLPCGLGHGKNDLMLNITRRGDVFDATLVYNADFFDKASVDSLTRHYLKLLAAGIAEPSLEIAYISLLTDEEKKIQLVSFNQTEAAYPENATLVDLFEQQVDRDPNAQALVYQGTCLTYGQLEADSNRLANNLRQQGVRPGQLVGLCLERTPLMITAIIGTIKAGGVYVPMDITYPDERLHYMCGDAAFNIVITQREKATFFAHLEAVVLDGNQAWRMGPDTRPVHNNTPDSRVYCIYTSGSLGRPKGVLLSHRNVVRLFFNSHDKFDFNKGDVWTLFHSYCFDFSVWEMYGALLFGGKLVVVPESVARDQALFSNLLATEKVTVLNQTPSAFYVLSRRMLEELERHTSTRMIIFGGEALDPSQLLKFREAFPSIQLINMYGITETCVHVTHQLLEQGHLERGVSDIGGPIPTTTLYVLDPKLELQPIGYRGQLFVGGLGLAHGYLNRKSMTAQRFIPNHLSTVPGDRLYCTGDLARLQHNGKMQYLGRIDHQVKIRGFRIELGEIENVLSQIEGVVQAAVLAHDSVQGHKILVAYIVGKDLNIDKVRTSLAKVLPSHMVPSFFMEVGAMPLTTNGKLDRKALPLPEIQSAGEERREAPESETERKVAEIFSEVLELKLVGRHANFFEIGGHSLLATLVVSRIRNLFGLELELRVLFEAPTVQALAVRIDQADPKLLNTTEIKAVSRALALPLSYSQQRLWFLQKLQGLSSAYHVPSVVRLQGALDVDSFNCAVVALQERQEVLRTTFAEKDGQPYLVFNEPLVRQVKHIQHPWTGGADTPLPDSLRQSLRAIIEEPFDMEKGPLFRVVLVQLGPQDHILLLVLHHIISDGWSTGVLISDLAKLYRAFCNNVPPELEHLPFQYADYAYWQRQRLDEQVLSQLTAYWKEKLSGIAPLLELPTDKVRPTIQGHRGGTVPFRLDAPATLALRQLCAKEEVTLFMALISGFAILLSRYSGSTDIPIGTVFANRGLVGMEGLLGFFVNTLVLRNQIETEVGVRPLLSRVKTTTLEAFKYQDMPFERLVEVIQPSRSLSHSPLFQVVLMLQNMPSPSPDLGNLTVTNLPGSGTTAKFDLTYSIFETDMGLEGQLEYNLDLYERESVTVMSEHFANLLVSMTKSYETPVSHLQMLSEWERTRAMVAWNATEQSFPQMLMHEMFDAHALANPERTALIHEGQTYSYGQLRKAALVVSQYLVEKGALPNKLVAVVIEKSFHQIAAVFGVLYAGAAYLPIEPGWPSIRRDTVLELGEVEHVLTSASTMTDEPWPKGVERIQLTDLLAQQRNVDEQPGLRQTEQDLAYVIFTSGSTGVPKGVVIEHFAVVNTLFDINHRFEVDEKDVILGLSSLCFDLSVYDIFGALGAGARLILPDRDSDRDPAHWVALLQNQGVTVWNTVPALMQMLVDEVSYQKPYGLDSLRLALLSGDWIPVGLPNQARKQFPNLVMFSLGGATEGSIWSIVYPITDVDPSWRSIPYGKPLANQKFFVFDRALQPCPVRVIGDLYIGGKGVALEYWRNPGKSAEHFFIHPQTGEKIYRTGDLGRYLPDGTIEFMGRADFQVKINGYRIELGDVESALKQFEGVTEAVCTIRTDSRGVRKLLAYVLGEQGRVPNGETLRQGVRELLPDYMIPAAVTLMDNLPLTPNGKVDREALQHPVILDSDEVCFVAPRTDLEAGLVKIWRELLHLERVGINDNFFKIGGDSIISMQLISRAKSLGLQLSPRLIFENQTIAELIEAVDGKTMIEAEQGVILGEAPLHPIHYWFFDHIQVDQHHFNQKILLASQEKLDAGLLQRVFDRLLRHHDSLRLNIVGAEHGRTLVFRAPEEMTDAFVVHDLTHDPDPSTSIRDLSIREQTSFQLDRGSLAKLVLFSTAVGEPDRLLFLAHHLVVDGVSWRILLEDLNLLYRGFKAGDNPGLPSKTTSFRYWGKKLGDYAQSDVLIEKAAFWQHMIGLPAPTLPKLRDGENLVGLTSTLSFVLEEDETRLLLQDASTAFSTEVNDLLLSALLLAFNQWTGQTSVKLTMEGHGRSDLFTDVDLSRTVGWFTCMFPVSLHFKDEDGLGELITGVKETLRSIPDGGLSYGVLKYLTDHVSNSVPQTEVCFNYLGQFDQMWSPDATFQVATDSAGSDHSPAQKRPWLLEIVALVAGSRLRVTMTYARDILNREQLEILQECYHSALLSVIEECVNHGGTLTRSDVDVAFEAEEFNDLLSELRDLDEYLEEQIDGN